MVIKNNSFKCYRTLNEQNVLLFNQTDIKEFIDNNIIQRVFIVFRKYIHIHDGELSGDAVLEPKDRETERNCR